MKIDFQSSRRDLLRFFAAAAPAAVASAKAIEKLPNDPAGSVIIPTAEETAWLTKAREPGDVEPRPGMALVELLPWLIYDRLTIPPGEYGAGHEFWFFKYPIGTLDPLTHDMKHFAHTNMTQHARLDMPHSFTIDWLYTILSPRTLPADAAELFDAASFQLWLGMKCYGRYPLTRFPIVGEVLNVLAAGKPDLPPGHKAVTPKLAHRMNRTEIPIGMGFWGELSLTRPIRLEWPLAITAVLDGMLSRYVQ